MRRPELNPPNEVIDYIQVHKDRRDDKGQRLVVRNGHLPEREVLTGVFDLGTGEKTKQR